MEKLLKKIILFCIVLIIIFSNCVVQATSKSTIEGILIADTEEDKSTIVDADEMEPEDISFGVITERAKIYVGIIRNIGIVVSVIALMLIGVRAMLGSAEEKADYKKSLPGYLVGAFLVFAITMIPTIIYNALEGLN